MDRALFARQWAPMVGTGLTILGSLYLLIAAEVEALQKTGLLKANPTDSGDGRRIEADIIGSSWQIPIDSFRALGLGSGRLTATSPSDTRPDASYAGHDLSSGRLCANCGHCHRQGPQGHLSRKLGTGIRGRVARLIIDIDDYLVSVKQEIFGDLELYHEEPAAVINVPGVELRNSQWRERLVVVRIQDHLASTEKLSLNLMWRAARTQPVQDQHHRSSLHDRHHHCHEQWHLEYQPAAKCQRQRRCLTKRTLLHLRLRQHWRTDPDETRFRYRK